MAETEVTPRRLVRKDEVYRQVFDAEVSFGVVFSCKLENNF